MLFGTGFFSLRKFVKMEQRSVNEEILTVVIKDLD